MQTWSAALLTAIAVISSAFSASTTALAEVEEGDNIEESNMIQNWMGTHSDGLVPGNYHKTETIDKLAQLVSKEYRKGHHIRPVGSVLSPNGIRKPL